MVAGAPFASDMTELLDHEIVAYGDYLAEHDVDAIWSVGGQIGSVTMQSAFRMSHTPEQVAALKQAPLEDRRRKLRSSYHDAPLGLAYLPTPGAFPRNAGAVTVANSVGLSGTEKIAPHLREEVVDVLRATDVVSVRDPRSSNAMQRLHVEHRLVPDVVHALAALFPAEEVRTSGTAVVQISDSQLRLYGEDAVVHALATSEALAPMPLQFVAAGVANGHDSIETLERLAARVQEVTPGREVMVDTQRRPMDIVDVVRRSQVVISTSLHMRIVAASYGVPRVTLERYKPAHYARHWDPLMPSNVLVPDLDAAVATALADADRADVRESAERLTRLADDNARDIADRVRELVRSDPGERAKVAQARITAYERLVARRAEEDEHTLALERALRRTRRELEEARAARQDPAPAPTWRRTAGRVRRRLGGAVGSARPQGDK